MTLSFEELTGDWADSLDLADDATPSRPLIAVDLDSAAAVPNNELQVAATTVRRGLPLVVGVASRQLAAGVEALVDALDVTLVSNEEVGCARREVVCVPDVNVALSSLAAAVTATPRAAIALGQVLRQTEQLDVHTGIAAEASAYSMLLAGREFESWLEARGAPRSAPDGDKSAVVVERHGNVLSVVLDRPERRNAFNAAMRDELVEALNVGRASPELTVELSGRGANFCSGGDLDEFGTATEVDSAFLVRLERHPGWLLHQLGERAVVKLHGACIGAGVEVPSLGHRVIAADDAYFALPEVSMGLIPGAGGTVGIPRRIGRWRTAWLALTGARIDANTALEWGLVDDVVRE